VNIGLTMFFFWFGLAHIWMRIPSKKNVWMRFSFREKCLEEVEVAAVDSCI
jgi:hypothetical protein